MTTNKPDIFAYLDYRKFLQDAFDVLKAESAKSETSRSETAKSGAAKVSFRSIAKVAGYSSPNFLQLVIAGKRNLSSAHLLGTVRAFALNKQEAEFFTNLVGFEQASGFEEKNFQYQKMLRSRRYIQAKPIEKGQFEYFEQWYHPVVRELLTHEEFTGDINWIAGNIYPPITFSQAEKSIGLLQKLGLVNRDEASGKWRQTEAVISTPGEIASLAVANYHRSVVKLASDSIDAFPSSERDIRTVTIGIPRSAFPEMKRKMEDFWKDLLTWAQTQKSVEDVYQINLHNFPLTKIHSDKSKGDAHA